MNDKGKAARSFVLGLLLGGALVFTSFHFCRHHWGGRGFWGRHEGFNSQRIFEKLNKELGLSAEQKVQVEKILETQLPKIKELRKTVRPRFDAVREQIQTEIHAVLKPDQIVKYNKIVAEFEKHRKDMEDKMEHGK